MSVDTNVPNSDELKTQTLQSRVQNGRKWTENLHSLLHTYLP